MTAIYDLYNGLTRQVLFNPDAAAPELLRVVPILGSLPQGSLIVGDRLYASIQFFWELSGRGLWGLFRLNGTLTVERQHLIGRRQGGGRTIVEEWLVLVGSGQTAPKITLRLICLRQGKLKRDLLTNVLDLQMLTAEEAPALYPLRWQIVVSSKGRVCRAGESPVEERDQKPRSLDGMVAGNQDHGAHRQGLLKREARLAAFFGPNPPPYRSITRQPVGANPASVSDHYPPLFRG